ncbi:unnamed protein product [Phytophthora fragariaefolia]|uniref:Unnamed protein product n=1 Tax=Phytophthora fragariaefolia TaxID=1490495 RepID=A0A9W7CWY5_9STRA|nr:unnamed protein product [Phytophthora fragariaefolia]
MVHLTHSSIHWMLRCIDDSSSDKNTPPNVLQAAPEQGSPSIASSATGTATPPWLFPEKTKHRSKFATNPPPSPTPETPPRPAPCACASPTTSSPARTKATTTRHPRQGLQERRQAAAPYARQRSTPHNLHRPAAAGQDRRIRVTDAAHGRYQAAATDQDRPVRRGAAAADQVHQACHRVAEPAPRAALLASQPGDLASQVQSAFQHAQACTGMPKMPPHIKKAKEFKQAIDDKANVVEMDDEADEDRPATRHASSSSIL